MKLPFEENKNLYAKYGLAVSLSNSAEYLVMRVIELEGELFRTHRAIFSTFFNGMTFGPKIELFSKIIADPDLFRELQNLNADRVLLAHGINAEGSDGSHALIFKNKIHKLTEDRLEKIINRARVVCALLLEKLGHVHDDLKKSTAKKLEDA